MMRDRDQERKDAILRGEIESSGMFLERHEGHLVAAVDFVQQLTPEELKKLSRELEVPVERLNGFVERNWNPVP